MRYFYFLIFLLLSTAYGYTSLISVDSGSSTLHIISDTGKEFYPLLRLNGTDRSYIRKNPISCEIVTRENTYYLTSPYQTLELNSDRGIVCSGVITTRAGSKISFRDTYRTLESDHLFEMIREVEILESNPSDLGFATRMCFENNADMSLHDYDFFVPGVWYKDNAYVKPGSLASDYSDEKILIREDRLPLPFIMLREKNTGLTFSIIHKDPDGSTFKEEKGPERIIDKRLKFASVGVENSQPLSIGITFPGSEEDKTYISRSRSENRGAFRNHPVEKGFRQNYKIAFRLSMEEDYTAALKNTWDVYYRLFSPKLYACDLDKIYDLQISVLDKYWKSINGTAGLPFRVLLNGNIQAESDYNFNMGFVGHQPGNASLLIREGLKKNNTVLLSKGEQMADFWATKSISESGCPKTWYDPYPQTWRGPEVALREIGDGMIELLRSWNYEQEYNRNKPDWLNACVKVADWIISTQLEDGSFYSHFDYNTGKHTKKHTNCTSHIIPYLTEMFMATGNETYKAAALKAGRFIYDDIMIRFRYVGGAIDNPNVMDKEAGSMALRAFLALYDLENSSRWMDAVMQTVYFYRSWVVCWDIPIPQDDPQAVFPGHRSVIGQSIIATGHSAADTYAAIDALGFYRAYLYSGDEQLLHFSKLLLYNTKQFMNWDPQNDPVPGIAEGLFGEAMNVCIPRGHGVDCYLPWATYNQLEPIVFLEDIFGFKDIQDIQKLTKSEIEKKHQAYSNNRLYKRANNRLYIE